MINRKTTLLLEVDRHSRLSERDLILWIQQALVKLNVADKDYKVSLVKEQIKPRYPGKPL